MDSYMASNGSCFMVNWIIFKNCLLEVGLIQHQETMTIQTLTTIFFFSLHVWGPPWIEVHWKSIWLRAQLHMTSHYTWGLVTTHMILEVPWDGLWTLFFGLSQFHGHGSWLVCEVTLSYIKEVHMLVHNFSSSQGYCRQQLLWRIRWENNEKKCLELEFSKRQVSCTRVWVCPKNLASRELPLAKKRRHIINHVIFSTMLEFLQQSSLGYSVR